jgi:hypothetical protein
LSAAAQDVRALHPFEGTEPRLHDANQVVGDLVVLENRRAEAQVHRGHAAVRGLDANGRDFRFRRQVGSNLIHPRSDVGQGASRTHVELQANVDRG